ncbi:MAG: flagellar assembly protein FliW [Myxococcota bacterium]
MSDAVWVEVAHRRVGDIRLPESAVIRFAGLPGFPEARRFALFQHDQDSPFSWLACLDDPDLAFVVTDPRLFFPDYAPGIPSRALEALGADGACELLSIANLRGERPCLNLAAPLVVDATSRRGVQVVLEEKQHAIAQALPEDAAKQAPARSGAAGTASGGTGTSDGVEAPEVERPG